MCSSFRPLHFKQSQKFISARRFIFWMTSDVPRCCSFQANKMLRTLTRCLRWLGRLRWLRHCACSRSRSTKCQTLSKGWWVKSSFVWSERRWRNRTTRCSTTTSPRGNASPPFLKGNWRTSRRWRACRSLSCVKCWESRFQRQEGFPHKSSVLLFISSLTFVSLQVYWFKDGKQILRKNLHYRKRREGDGTCALHIDFTTSDDDGNYTVMAANPQVELSPFFPSL